MVAGNSNPFTFVRLKYGNNATDTVTGMVIYPDDFSFADAGVGAMTFGIQAPTAIDIDSWRALETAGCVFLPACTSRDATEYKESTVGLYAYYWSSTTASSASQARQMVYNISTNPPFMTPDRVDGRFKSFSVRLVQDY